MSVLVLSDGVAGHDRASEGIVKALAEDREVSVEWLGIEEVRTRSRRLARISASHHYPDRWLTEGCRISSRRVPERWAHARRDAWPFSTDVVVSTGPSTAAANIAAARRYGAKSIYCGFAKWPVTGFDLILSPVPSISRKVALAPRPSDIDATALPQPRPLGTPGPRRLALLIGGESKHYRYTTADMGALGGALAAILDAQEEWALDVFDSRRTDAGVFEALADKLAPHPARARIHRFADGGLGSNQTAFSADVVLVTADSLSMTTEALAAARPTVVVRADAYRGPRRDRGELKTLARKGYVCQSTISELSVAVLKAAPSPPLKSQPAALAKILAAHGI